MFETKWLKYVLDRCITVQHRIGVPKPAENALEDILEYSFSCITSLLYNFPEQMKLFSKELLVKFDIFAMNLHNCDNLSVENAAECLQVMIENDKEARAYVMTSCLDLV